MTDERRGKILLLVILLPILILGAAMVLLALFLEVAPVKLFQSLVRFTLEIVLVSFVVLGRAWARWTLAFLLGLSGGYMFVIMINTQSVVASIGLSILGLYLLTSSWLLAQSRLIRMALRH